MSLSHPPAHSFGSSELKTSCNALPPFSNGFKSHIPAPMSTVHTGLDKACTTMNESLMDRTV